MWPFKVSTSTAAVACEMTAGAIAGKGKRTMTASLTLWPLGPGKVTSRTHHRSIETRKNHTTSLLTPPLALSRRRHMTHANHVSPLHL